MHDLRQNDFAISRGFYFHENKPLRKFPNRQYLMSSTGWVHLLVVVVGVVVVVVVVVVTVTKI